MSCSDYFGVKITTKTQKMKKITDEIARKYYKIKIPTLPLNTMLKSNTFKKKK